MGFGSGAKSIPLWRHPCPTRASKKGRVAPHLTRCNKPGSHRVGVAAVGGHLLHDSHQPAFPPLNKSNTTKSQRHGGVNGHGCACVGVIMVTIGPRNVLRQAVISSILASWRRAIPDALSLNRPLSSRLSSVNWLALQPGRGEPKLSSLFSTPPSHPRLPKALCHCGGTGSVNPSAAS